MNATNNANLFSREEVDTIYARLQLDDTGLCLNGTPNKKSRGIAGYKTFTHYCSAVGKRKSFLAHCVAWRKLNNYAQIPHNRVVSHICGESYCCRCLELADANLNDSRKYCHNELLWQLDQCPHALAQFDGKQLKSCQLKRLHAGNTSEMIFRAHLEKDRKKKKRKLK